MVENVKDFHRLLQMIYIYVCVYNILNMQKDKNPKHLDQSKQQD